MAQYIILLFLITANYVEMSHFRGGIVTWKPGDKERELKASYRISLRRSYSVNTQCTSDIIKSKTLQFSGESKLTYLKNGVLLYYPDAGFYCTDFNLKDDWITGEFTDYALVANDDQFSLGFNGGNWINLVNNGGGTWNLYTTVNLTKRSDTKRPNSSPVSTTAPIVNVQFSCLSIINIGVSDPDNDIIKCRFAQGFDECGSICGGLPGATIDEKNCAISYNASQSIGLFGVAIQIEDFASPFDKVPLSSVGLQFLINVQYGTGNCSSQPIFSTFTRKDKTCIGILANEVYVERFYATTLTSDPIIEFSTSSPYGLTKSAVSKAERYEHIYKINNLPNNVYWYYVEVSWIPSISQAGVNAFCIFALATSGSTPQQCISLVVGVPSPKLIMDSVFPKPGSIILPSTNTWILEFDQMIMKPTHSVLFQIYNFNYTLKYSKDIFLSNDFEITSNNQTIVKTPKIDFVEKETYFLIYSHGIVVGLNGLKHDCGLESFGVFGNWSFTIKDVTPPSLSFVYAPLFTNAQAELRWVYNEIATSSCILKTPVSTFQVDCASNEWNSSILDEGNYTLSIIGIDLANNSALSVTHSWFVDTSPPVVSVVNRFQLSNRRNESIKFFCDTICIVFCKLLEENQTVTPTENCTNNISNGIFIFNVSKKYVLKSGKNYTLEVNATDLLGNIAKPWRFLWLTDFDPPNISAVNDVTISCNDYLLFDNKPIVTDMIDINPSLTYTDIKIGSCSVLRTWSAKDAAGNLAESKQLISLMATAIQVNLPESLVVPCGHDFQSSNNISKMVDYGLVVHSSCFAVKSTVHVSPEPVRCDSIVMAFWEFSDSCGQETNFQQVVKVLPMQLPFQPQNGVINVDIGSIISWPPYPNTDYYLLLLWKFGEQIKGNKKLYSNSYTLSVDNFLPNTQYLWRIDYVLQSSMSFNNLSIVSSPTWGFTTKPYADFKLEAIIGPSEVFTGRYFEVLWKVSNVGSNRNSLYYWYDKVFVSKNKNAISGLLTKTIQRTGFLLPKDSYTGQIRISVPEDMILGTYYIIVFVDYMNYGNEFQRDNNLGYSLQSFEVRLTPPPDLYISSITTPPTTFSGQSIEIIWKVQNQGYGITSVSEWSDQIYWVSNSSTNLKPTTLATVLHSGELQPLEYYSVKQVVDVPKYIFGSYKIMLYTDVYNNVFENYADENNQKTSEVIKVILTPPPDLSVNGIELTKDFLVSGDTLIVNYTVTNIGGGETDKSGWHDRIEIYSENKKDQVYSTYLYVYTGVMNPYEEYSREVSFTIPYTLVSGEYLVIVSTDVFNSLFEFNSKDNNQLKRKFNVTQQLPDLAVTHFNFELNPDYMKGQTNLTLKNVVVTNVGKSDLTKSFMDVIYITENSLDNKKIVLAKLWHNTILKVENSYVIELEIPIPRKVVANMKLMFYTDFYNNVLEIEESNNFYTSNLINIPIFYDNIIIQIVNLFSSNGLDNYVSEELFSGDKVTVTLNYKNLNIYSTSAEYIDDIYIKNLENKILLTKVYNNILTGSLSVTKDIQVSIPSWFYGEAFIIIEHDTQKTLSRSSDSYSVSRSIFISVPLSPDLKPNRIYVELNEGSSLLKVSWSVINVGNSMRNKLVWKWKDYILLSPNNTNPFANGWMLLKSYDISYNLQNGQEYSQISVIPIVIKSSGSYFVFIVTDAENNINEKDGESNNYLSFQIKVVVTESNLNGVVVTKSNITEQDNYFPYVLPVVPVSDLVLFIENVSSYSVTAGFRSNITYSVKNILQPTTVSSWTDEVSISAFMSENYIPILVHSHVGGLGTNKSYTSTVSFTFPVFLKKGDYVIKVTTDVNKRCNEINRYNNFIISNKIAVSEPELVDLVIFSYVENLAGYGGQPLSLSYNVSNLGPGNILSYYWFDSLYLSIDALLDPFDVRLVTQYQNHMMLKNSSYTGFFQCNLPFNLLEKKYYLLLKVDSGDVVPDINQINNIVAISLSIIGTEFTLDLAVSNLTVSKSIEYGKKLRANWVIINNGTDNAIGYKCDVVYLSEDTFWDSDDTEVATSCSFISIQTHSFLEESIIDFVPLVKKSSFYSIVKTRSSILDFNTSNNEITSLETSMVLHDVLNISKAKNITIYNGKEYVLLIPGVVSGQTIIVTAKSYDERSNIGLYVKFGRPATSGVFDEFQGDPKSEQKVVIKNAKRGDYYLLITYRSKSDNLAPNLVSVEARLSKLEIVSVFPNVSPASLLPVTFQIQGSLFPSDYELSFYCISDEEKVAIPIKSYRFSSTLLYATVSFFNFTIGNKVGIHLVDLVLLKELKTESVIEITDVPNGILKTHVHTSGVARSGEEVEITISIHNDGGTDILSPIFYLDVQGDVTVRVNKESFPFENNQNLIFIPAPTGPAGILTPGSINTLDLSVSQKTSNAASVPISFSQVMIGEQNHPYVFKKNDFRPLNFDNRRWNPVWNLFMKKVGLSMVTFHKRMCETLTHLSILNQNVIFLDQLVQFELNMADGLSMGNQLYSTFDIKASSDKFPFLTIERFFSPRLSFRDIPGKFNGYGPFGKGWISPLWSIKITNVTLSYIILERDSDHHVFINGNKSDFIFINPGGIGIITNTKENYIFEELDKEPNLKYLFDKDSLLLVGFQSIENNTNIYIDDRFSQIRDNYGNSLNISYGDNFFVQEIQLIKDGNLSSFARYTYDNRNFLTMVSLNNLYNEFYEYDISIGALKRVIKPDSSSITYLYNENGVYSGEEFYSSENTLLKKVSYKEIGAGDYEMFEQTSHKTMFLKYNTDGKLVYTKPIGFPPYRSIFVDDWKILMHDDLIILKEKYIEQNTKVVEDAEEHKTVIKFLSDGVSFTELQDSAKNIYRASYNGEELSNTSYPDGHSEYYFYDKNGFVSHLTTRSGNVISYDRDDQGNIFAKNDNNTQKVRFEYKDGLMIKAIKDDSFVELSYDSLKRPISITYDRNISLFYTYDNEGRRKTLSDSTGLYKITYEYDTLGRTKSVKRDDNQKLMDVKYQDEKVAIRDYGDGSKTSYFYGSVRGELNSLIVENKYSIPLRVLNYTYDRFGRISELIDDNKNWKYSYDLTSQIISFEESSNVTEIEYDSVLNRIYEKKSEPIYYTYNELNQLKTAGPNERISYDDDGNLMQIENLLTRKGQRFQYDAENKVESTVNDFKNCTYKYDALENLKSSNCSGVVTEYLIDPFGIFGADIIGKSSKGSVTLFYYGMEQGLICKNDVQSNKTFYFHFNYLGSTVVTTFNGFLSNSYAYDPFGNILLNTEKPDELDANEFLFVGQWGVRKMDGFSEIYLMRTRMYHSKYGRFMSLDPYRFSGKSTNLYCYMGNNPMAGTDPHGTAVSLGILGAPALIGAIVDVGLYLGSHLENCDAKLSELAKAAVKGAIGNAFKSKAKFSKYPFLYNVGGDAIAEAIGSFVEYIIKEDKDKSFNFVDNFEKMVALDLVSIFPYELHGSKAINRNNIIGKQQWIRQFNSSNFSLNIMEAYGNLKKDFGKVILKEVYNMLVQSLKQSKIIQRQPLIQLIISSGFSFDITEANETSKEYFVKIILQTVLDVLVQNLNNRNIFSPEDIIDDIVEIDFQLVDIYEKGLDQIPDFADYIMNKVSLYLKKSKDCIKDNLKNGWDGILRWVTSFDPNDIIGPDGFGDAHFIPPDIVMKYKILFENKMNATAPAQKVSIKFKLDASLDFSTFRIGKLAFGNNSYEPPKSSPVLQIKIYLGENFLFYVRVTAGVDVFTGDVIFDLEAIDTETGQRPTSPLLGFLPPNPINGTSGQGFITYSVKPKQGLPNLSTINAKASIVFDENEPIDTPLIFNTIDSDLPSANLIYESNSTVVSFEKFDNGSGVKYIDIYYKNEYNEMKILAEGVGSSPFTYLPLTAGTYELYLVAVDNVGNKGNISKSNIITVLGATCEAVNNCSGHGNCTGLNLCLCEDGKFGNDCSSDDPVLEPPILASSSDQILEDLLPIPLNIFFNKTGSSLNTLNVTIQNIPESVIILPGIRNGSTLTINQEDTKNLTLIFTKTFDARNFTLKIVAVQRNRNGLEKQKTVFTSIIIVTELAECLDYCNAENSSCKHLNGSFKCICLNGHEFNRTTSKCQDTYLWTAWQEWSVCSVSCGNGTIFRNRFCYTVDNAAPAEGCFGNDFEEKSCNAATCPILCNVMKRQNCSNFTQLNAVNFNSLVDIATIKDISDGISNWSAVIKNLTLGCDLVALTTAGKKLKNQINFLNKTNNNISLSIAMVKDIIACNSNFSIQEQSYKFCEMAIEQNSILNKTLLQLRLYFKQLKSAFGICNASVISTWSQWASWSNCPVSCNGGISHRKRICYQESNGQLSRACIGNDAEMSICNSQTCSNIICDIVKNVDCSSTVPITNPIDLLNIVYLNDVIVEISQWAFHVTEDLLKSCNMKFLAADLNKLKLQMSFLNKASNNISLHIEQIKYMIVCTSNLILKKDLYNTCLTALHKDTIVSALLNHLQTFVHQYEKAITSCQKCGFACWILDFFTEKIFKHFNLS